MNPYREHDLRKFLVSLSQEEIEQNNAKQAEENKRAYEQFRTDLQRNICFLCKLKMDQFDEHTPCFHWLTCPSGIRKKHFMSYFKKPVSFFRLEIYLRWLANTERFMTNINDLDLETSSTSFLETTIRYKNIEWSFSVGRTDVEGHPDSHVGNEPHYHLQLTVNGQILIRFNDCHIRFSEDDLFMLELMRQAGDLFDIGHSFGEGVGEFDRFTDKESLEIIDEFVKVADDEQTAPFRRETLIMAPPGQTISGELLANAAEQSKITKEPIGRILARLVPNATVQTVISPSDAVPVMKKRSGKK